MRKELRNQAGEDGKKMLNFGFSFFEKDIFFVNCLKKHSAALKLTEIFK